MGGPIMPAGRIPGARARRAGGRLPMSRQMLFVLAATCLWVSGATVARAQATQPAALGSSSSAALSIQPSPSAAGAAIHLVGKHSRQQLAVTARLTAEQVRDVTRAVTYSVEPAGVVQIDPTGMVT